MLWLEGRLTPDSTAPFDLSDRGLLLGDGVFDTALALNGRIAFEGAHLQRLAAGAEALGFSIDLDVARSAMRALAATGPRLSIRVTATRGPARRGLAAPSSSTPTLWASAAEVGDGLIGAPTRLWPTAIRRNDTSPTSRLKTLGYLDAILAAGEARDHGFADSLFLNTRGAVACSGVGNLFVCLGGRLVTPPLSDGVLNGITRRRVLELAPSLGLAIEERSLILAEAVAAEAAFVTNSLRLISPVEAIGAARLDSLAHDGTRRLLAALRDDVAMECGIAGQGCPT